MPPERSRNTAFYFCHCMTFRVVWRTQQMDDQSKRAQAFMDKYGKVIENTNKAFFENDTDNIDGIYIDLVCLKDLRMGLMLSLCETPEEQEYLQKHLRDYNNKPRRTFVKDAYPNFKYTEEELQEKYKSIGDNVFDISPDTSIVLLLPTLLSTASQNKDMHGRPVQFTVTVNCFPLKITDLVKQYINLLEQYLSHHVKVIAISQDPCTLTDGIWSSHQVYFFDSLQRMLQPTSSIFSSFFNEHTFYNNIVYAPYEVEDKIYSTWLKNGFDISNEQSFVTYFEPTKLYLNFCCKFSYMTYDIPLTDKS